MIDIKRIVVGDLESCCYVITTRCKKEAMLIDPGGSPEKIINYCHSNSLIPDILVNTHGHGDHIGANLELKDEFPDIKIYIHADDAPMLTNEYLNLSLLGGKRYQSPPADKVLLHDDVIVFNREEFNVIHTPGHTKGGICLLYNQPELETPILFSGDSLFNYGIGRTDLPGGDHELLINSIKDRLFTLNDNTVVYPGHGEATTILNERRENPFFVDTVNI